MLVPDPAYFDFIPRSVPKCAFVGHATAAGRTGRIPFHEVLRERGGGSEEDRNFEISFRLLDPPSLRPRQSGGAVCAKGKAVSARPWQFVHQENY